MLPLPPSPGSSYPSHYSVVPPARVLFVRHGGDCQPLSGPAGWRSSTTDAPGRWTRSSYGAQSLENCADERAAGSRVSCSFRTEFSVPRGVKVIPASRLLSCDCKKNRFQIFLFFLPHKRGEFPGRATSCTTNPTLVHHIKSTVDL